MKVLYEDSNILAIDKPSGISTHADGRGKEKTIADWVLKNYPRMKNVGENEIYQDKIGKKIKIEIPKPGIVHRLDRDTSGVMLLAKNQKAYEFLKKQFSAPALEIAKGGLADRQDRVKKVYVAIVSGWVKDDRGIINKPIGRSPTDFRRYSATRGARGEMREAVTQYKVLKRFKAPCVQNFSRFTRQNPTGSDTDKNFEYTAPFTYLEVRPKTGRTHQIRVHMKAIDHPVACDPLYNPKSAHPKVLKRLALHAKSIEFKNLKGETVKVESPLPKEFKEVVK